jgi:alkylated DNA repair protein alkB family protein 6
MNSVPAQVNLPPSLETCRIGPLPPAAYYIADFITEEEEQAILHKVARHAPILTDLNF